MKLKLVVASMSVLGLISCPFAVANAKHMKQKTHTVAQEYKGQDFKGMGALVCQPDPYQPLLDRLSQNVGRAMPSDTCKPIAFAGGINFDTMWGNRRLGYMGENTQRFALNDAYLNVVGNVNDWTTAFASISYSNFREALVDAFTTAGQRPGIYSSAYTTSIPGTSVTSLQTSGLDLEQGIITVKNWNYAPVYLQLGKQFQDFGRYTIHPIVRTMDQVLSETLQTSAELGFIVPMGVHGDVFVFNNPMRKTSQSHTQTNYGVTLGYDNINDAFGWDIGAGYMYNMTGVNDVAYGVGAFNGTGQGGTFISRVGAADVYGDINSGPFNVGVRYVTALQHFNIADLGNNASGIVASTHGAKPWAAGITAGYGFNYWDRNQMVYLGYQGSSDAINLFLPENRWILGYGIDFWKNTNVGLQLTHNNDYSASDGGTGESSNEVGLRVAVKFG